MMLAYPWSGSDALWYGPRHICMWLCLWSCVIVVLKYIGSTSS
jgi:hypothetical protein